MKSIIVGSIVLIIASLASANDSQTRYQDVQDFLRKLVQTYPQTVSLVNVGPSDSGTPIEGVKIGTGSTHELVVATHHGNESGSTDVSEALAQMLAANPIENRQVTIIPVLNISGYNHDRREEALDGKLVDPNRDYPSPCGSAAGPFSLKSTQSLAHYLESENIVAALTLHDPFSTITYPWGFQKGEATLYDNLFHDLAVDASTESHYTIGTSANAIYEAHGVFEDYAFWKHGIWTMLYEIGPDYSLDPANLANAVRDLIPGMIRFLKNTPSQAATDHAFKGTCGHSHSFVDRGDE
jgi:carboxypeptidase T